MEHIHGILDGCKCCSETSLYKISPVFGCKTKCTACFDSSALYSESLVCLPCSAVCSLRAAVIDKSYLRKKYTLQVVTVCRLSQFKLRFLVEYMAQFLCYAVWRTHSRSVTSPRQNTQSYRPDLEINDPSCCMQCRVTFSLAILCLFVGLAPWKALPRGVL